MKLYFIGIVLFTIGCTSNNNNKTHHNGCDEYFYRAFIQSTKRSGNSFDEKLCKGSNELYLFMLNPDQKEDTPKIIIKFADLFKSKGIYGISHLSSNELYALYLYFNFTVERNNSISRKDIRKILYLSIDKDKNNPLPYISKLYEKYLIDSYIPIGTETQFVDSLITLYPDCINLYELKKELTLFDGLCVDGSYEQKRRITNQLLVLKRRGYYNKSLFGDSLIIMSNQIDTTFDKIEYNEFMKFVYEFNYSSRFENKWNTKAK